MEQEEYKAHLLDDAFWRAVDALNQVQARCEDGPVTDEMSHRSKLLVEKLMRECKQKESKHGN